MKCGIRGKIVDAKVVSRGASGAPGCSNRNYPILVEYQGEQTWVYEDTLDARTIPTDDGPHKPDYYPAR